MTWLINFIKGLFGKKDDEAMAARRVSNKVTVTAPVVAKNTITYGPFPLNTADVYRNKNATVRQPAVVMIIGGTFSEATVSNREKWDAECRKIAATGRVAMTISYRGTPSNYFPDTMADVRAAIAWLKAQSFVEPARVCAWGRSAGSFMAARMATEELVKCAMLECGPLGDCLVSPKVTTWFNGANPLVEGPRFRVTPTTKPMMLVHGTKDTTVPVKESVDMKATLDAAGVPATLKLHAGGHGKFPSSLAAGLWTAQMNWLNARL